MRIKDWCEAVSESVGGSGASVEQLKPSVEEMVTAVKTMEELVLLWQKVEHSEVNRQMFTKRKSEIESEGRYSNGTH